ncbi:MAG TPA: FecR domain-containing protein [Thermoanaerobaculia bacterium]|nr:FecR domain-containing protein [Thermoanaerobaculia bacterium]
MAKRKPGQPVGSDIDWFVIPIQRIRQAGVVLVILLIAGAAGYFLYTRSRRSPEEKARAEISSASALLARATAASGAARPGSHLAQARDALRSAEDAYARRRFEEAFRQAVESQSYSRRALGGAGTEETGDASFISIEGDVSLQSAGRSTFEPARQRQALFDGDFVKTGRTGSAEIMFSDGTLYTLRPGSLFEVHRPSLSESTGSQVKMVSGAINVYTAGSTSKIATDAATADVDRDSRVALDVEQGDKTEVTSFRGRTTVSTGRETVVLTDRERVSAAANTGAISAKTLLPESPQPLLPSDNRIYDLKTSDQIDLRWSAIAGAPRYRLQISRSRLFVPDAIEVDLDHRTETYAVVKVSREGSYFWRVASINREGVSSDWSAVRRFKMLAEPPRVGAHTAPPPLSVSPPQQMGNLFLIFGKTDAGATVTVNGETADVESDGSFRKTITIDRDGYAMLIVKATDASGNETVKRIKVFVETL